MAIIFLAFLASAAFFAFSDLRTDMKSGSKLVVAVYLALMTWSVVLCICVLRCVELTSPSKLVETVVKAFLPPLK